MTNACERTQQRERRRERKWSAPRERKREKKKIRGKEKVKRAQKYKRRLDSFLLTSADSALVVGCSLVRRGCRAARVHRFVSPFAHLFSFLFVCVLKKARLVALNPFFFFWRREMREKKGSIFLIRILTQRCYYCKLRQHLKKSSHLSTRVKLKNAQS